VETKFLAGNGTLTQWNVNGIHVLFPEQHLEVGGSVKLRGGAPICCPIFGPMPDTEDYEGIVLPQHGLVRTGVDFEQRVHTSLNTKEELNGPRSGATVADGWDTLEHYFVTFSRPWPHRVVVCFETANDNSFLSHQILVQYCPERNKICRGKMPISLCLHPYFATYGKPFRIELNDVSIYSENIQEKVSQSLACTAGGALRLFLEHGVVELEIPFEGGYTDFNIWTDAIDKYICIEPYLGKGKTYYIRPNKPLVAQCYLSFRSRVV